MEAAPSRPALRIAPASPALRAMGATLAVAEREALAAAWKHDAEVALAARARYHAVEGGIAAAGAPAALVDALRRASAAAAAEAGRAARLSARWGGGGVRVVGARGGAERPGCGGAVEARLLEWIAESCVADTLAVAEAAARLATATDPEVRGALLARLKGLGRSASVGWEAARWAIATGGTPARATLRAALARAAPAAAEGPDIVSAALRAHGLAPRGELDAVRRAALVAVVWPAAAALVGPEERSHGEE